MDKKNQKKVLAIGTHPDDIEILGAGTLALLKENGWIIEFATMTPGDCGSTTLSREEISKIRRREAENAAKILGGNYHCMECDDIFILYDRPTLLKTIKLIREVQPDIVFSMSPQDYMIDHEITSDVVRTACFSAGIANIDTDGVKPYLKIPYLYYFDPIEGKNILGEEIHANIIVDISKVMKLKEKMFLCHESQQSWLKSHHGADEYINSSLRKLSAKRGKEIGAEYGEGFRQHLGHAYPQDNILKKELGDVVYAR